MRLLTKILTRHRHRTAHFKQTLNSPSAKSDCARSVPDAAAGFKSPLTPAFPTIAFVAAEASGDLLGYQLLQVLRERMPNARFVGIGGPRMRGLGFESWWAQEKLAVCGLVEVLRHCWSLLRVRRRLRQRLKAERPAVFIGIDGPDFNLSLERSLRRYNIPTIHLVSPAIWAWRPKRIRKIRRAVDHMLLIFPFEVALYQQHGITATYIGHPLADRLPLFPNRNAQRKQMKIAEHRPVIALLPGSRLSEVSRHASLFIETARRIQAVLPDALFLVPLITRENLQFFKKTLFQIPIDPLSFNLMYGHATEAMIAADVVLVASGTATLEAALLKRPMVIAYQLSPLTAWWVRRRLMISYVGLPNILCEAYVVPEFLQKKATAEVLASALLNWLKDQEKVKQLQQRFLALHYMLRGEAAERAADVIESYVTQHAANAKNG